MRGRERRFLFLSGSLPAQSGAVVSSNSAAVFCLWAGFVLAGCGVTPPAAANAPPEWSESGYTVLTEEKQLESAPRVAARAPLPRTVTRIGPTASNAGCLKRLVDAGVNFRELPSLRGVVTPVRVAGPLGGVTFFSNHGRQLDLDCRLAIALLELASEFRALGVTKARFSGAYDYRTTRTGRLSHHAFGLAIDIHEVWVREERYSVQQTFAKGRGCPSRGPVLNALACTFKASGLFEEVLTPDYNWDHRDHLHVAVPKRPEALAVSREVPAPISRTSPSRQIAAR